MSESGTSVYRRFGKAFRFTNLIKCEDGFFSVTRGGGKVYNNDGSTLDPPQLESSSAKAEISRTYPASRPSDAERTEVIGFLTGAFKEGKRFDETEYAAAVTHACATPTATPVPATTLTPRHAPPTATERPDSLPS